MRGARVIANLSPQTAVGHLTEFSPRQHDDRNVRGRFVGAQPPQQIFRITVRHEIVSHDHGGLNLAGRAECIVRVGGVSRINSTFSEPTTEISIDVIVGIDEQYARTPTYLGKGLFGPAASRDFTRYTGIYFRQRGFQLTPEMWALAHVRCAQSITIIECLGIPATRDHNQVYRSFVLRQKM